MIKFRFTPNNELECDNVAENIKVKGQMPRLTYTSTLLQIYPTISSFDVLTAYRKISSILQRTDAYLFSKLLIKRSLIIPIPRNVEEARTALNFLFDTTVQYPTKIPRNLARDPHQFDLFNINPKFPFLFNAADRDKLLYSLSWIDSNVKLQIEKICMNLRLPEFGVRLLVESALTIYCILVKSQDYFLAKNYNYNYSMFFQDRIIALLLNSSEDEESKMLNEESSIINSIALDLLQQFTDNTYLELFKLSVFAGIAWANSTTVIAKSQAIGLSEMEKNLNIDIRKFCIDNRIDLLNDIQTGSKDRISVICILDDNGESVFDMAIFQKLLLEFSKLEVSFVLNSFPVSNNISLSIFKSLLKEAYFKDLRRMIHFGRVKLIVEFQVFRSFELSNISKSLSDELRNADILYIKGANFFETFQIKNKLRYYAFTVHSLTSKILTGCEKSSGIFARIPAKSESFVYSDREIITLKESIDSIS